MIITVSYHEFRVRRLPYLPSQRARAIISDVAQ
jgi:hypothetical protein